MKKIIGVLAVLGLLAIGVQAIVAGAQPPTTPLEGAAPGPAALPGSGWQTGVQIQNVGTANATITVRYYDSNSGAVYTYNPPSTVAPSASITILGSEATGWSPSNPPSGFIGSAVIESDQPILAIVNENNGAQGAAAQYRGSGPTSATEAKIPLVKSNLNGKSVDIIVQNIGTTTTTVTVNYSGKIGTTPTTGTASREIGPNRSWLFKATDSVGNSFLGAATVTSSGQPIVAVSNEYFSDSANPNFGKVLHAVNGFASTAATTKAYAPIQKKSLNGRSTGLQVQNAGAAAGDICVTWTQQLPAAGAGTQVVRCATGIAAGESSTFFGSTMPTPVNYLGSAVITGTQPIVAIVNESFDAAAVPATGQKLTTYAAINDNIPTTKIYVPLQKKNLGGNNTGIQVMNVGSGPADITITYYWINLGGGSCSLSRTGIAANAATTFLNVSCVPSGSYGSAVVTANQPIVAIVNESHSAGAQDTKNYEGFNQ